MAWPDALEAVVLLSLSVILQNGSSSLQFCTAETACWTTACQYHFGECDEGFCPSLERASFKHELLFVLLLVLEEGPLGEGGAGLGPELLLDFFPHLPEGVHLEALNLPALDFMLELLGILKDEHQLLVPELDVGALGGGRRT